ncbi:7807_t:CDS:2, partial [Gigaspora margarita]
ANNFTRILEELKSENKNFQYKIKVDPKTNKLQQSIIMVKAYVVQAFMNNESADSFIWIFNTFLEIVNNNAPKVFLTDEDQAIIKAINQEKLKNDFLESINYLNKMDKNLQKWASCFNQKFCMPNITTTQRSESMYNLIKGALEYNKVKENNEFIIITKSLYEKQANKLLTIALQLNLEELPDYIFLLRWHKNPSKYNLTILYKTFYNMPSNSIQLTATNKAIEYNNNVYEYLINRTFQKAANKGENSEQKNFFPNIVKHNISEDISKKLTLILTETFTIDYGNLEMQQQIQRFLEEYFENPKSSNKETIESNKPSVSNRNKTTTLKGKGILQEKDKTENLDHYEDITKPVMSINTQEMQASTTKLTNKQMKSLNSSHPGIPTAPSKLTPLGRSKLQLTL